MKLETIHISRGLAEKGCKGTATFSIKNMRLDVELPSEYVDRITAESVEFFEASLKELDNEQ